MTRVGRYYPALLRWAVFRTITFVSGVDGNEASYDTVMFAVVNVLLCSVSKFGDTLLIFCLLQSEMSHRSSDFNKILDRTKNLLRELL